MNSAETDAIPNSFHISPPNRSDRNHGHTGIMLTQILVETAAIISKLLRRSVTPVVGAIGYDNIIRRKGVLASCKGGHILFAPNTLVKFFSVEFPAKL